MDLLLVVSADAALRRILLRRAGRRSRVFVVESPAKAHRFIRGVRFTAVAIDVDHDRNLVDAGRLFQEVARVSPTSRRIILGASPYAVKEALASTLAHGYLLKPLRAADLESFAPAPLVRLA